MILHPRPAAKELVRFYRDFMEQAPDEVGGGLALITAPLKDFVPEQARGRPACGVVVVYVGDPLRGEDAFRPLLEWGEPWVKLVAPMPYVAVQQLIDAANPWGINEYAKIDYQPELPDEAIDAIVDVADEAPSPFTQVILCPLGGALSRTDRRAMALALPDANWMYFCLAKSWDPTQNDELRAWARAFMQTMRRWSVDKAPANFIESDEGPARLRRSYGDEKFARLEALKDEYDPDNVFSLNPNILPTTARVKGAR
jgi:hypothetical protein